MTQVNDVTVVGTGPNGLAAAVIFAAAGLSVSVVEAQSVAGGGARTEELDLGVPLLHDLCSAVHPMAAASPFATAARSAFMGPFPISDIARKYARVTSLVLSGNANRESRSSAPARW